MFLRLFMAAHWSWLVMMAGMRSTVKLRVPSSRTLSDM